MAESTPEFEAYRKAVLNAKRGKKQGDEQITYTDSSLLEKAANLARSVVSRGITNKKAPQETIELRHLSCHGDGSLLPPCSERRDSEKVPGSFYCGACGCGDKKTTQLINLTINAKENYSKLDYPTVSCPLKMPGFSTYVPSEDGVSENNRKKEIETRLGIDYTTKNSK